MTKQENLKFDFDSQKDRTNFEKHGVDFEEAQELWQGPHLIIPAKNVAGESRFAILGVIREKVYVGIYTERDEIIRIISCRRADKKLERIFYEHLKKNEGEKNY
jgi:uncharacterized DUF497 family protein